MSAVFSTARLHGKTVLITGASGGIGASTAELFAKAGCNLILLARRAEKLQEVKKRCQDANKLGGSGKGGSVLTLTVDVAKRAELDALLGKIKGEGAGPVDILVNNAGLVKGIERVGDIAEEDIDVMFNTNVLGLINLTQIFVREFKQRSAGHIINLGSVAGREAYVGGSIYCATKFAVAAFGNALMKELVDTPIRVTEVQPGMVETEFSVTRFRGDKDKAGSVYKGLQPLTGEDIAEEIVWTASRPDHVQIAELFVMPTAQASATINHRKA